MSDIGRYTQAEGPVVVSARTTPRRLHVSLSPLRRLSGALGINTMLGRFMVSAVILVVATIAVAWIADERVNHATQDNTSHLSDRAAISHSVSNLGNMLWQTHVQFQSYMLVPERRLQQSILQNIDSIIEATRDLHQHRRVTEFEFARTGSEQLTRDAQELRGELANVMDMRATPIKVFAAMPILVNVLNPLNGDFLGVVALGINEADDSPDDPQQRLIGRMFDDIRYLWAQRINTFRVLATSRVGVFAHSVEANIRDTTQDIATYDSKIAALLSQLRLLDAQGKLGFQQSEALSRLTQMRDDWNKGFERVKTILSRDDGWRLDTPILRDRIQPLFVRIWETLRRIDSDVEQRAIADIGATSDVADQVSGSLWLLAGVVLAVALFGTLVFEFQIRRPITRMSRALKAEAAGETDIALPDSSIVETRDLVTAFTHMREQIHTRQEHLQAVLTYTAEAIITTDAHGRIESFNPAAEHLFGQKAEDVIGSHIAELAPEYGELLDKISDGHERETHASRRDGKMIPVGMRVSDMHVGGRALKLVTFVDISVRREMLDAIQAREQRLRSILDNTAEGIVTFDEHGKIETWNTAAKQLFGFGEKDALETSITQLVSPESQEIVDAKEGDKRFSGIQTLVDHEGDVVGHRQDGSTFPVSLKVSRMVLDGCTKYTALLANISERKALMENLRRMAEHDGLTGLHNRTYFHAILERTVERVRRNESTTCALLYIDLDNFKYVNDTLGHAAGDKLLVDIAQLLNRRVRRSDVVARLGGDEFVVLVDGAAPDLIHTVAESFRRHLADYAFRFEGQTVDVGCSIGVAIINKATASSSEILSHADVACHLAKRAGRNRVHVFLPDDAKDVRTMSMDMGWSRRIRLALENDHFVLACQPVVNCLSQSVVCNEILLRMRDDDGSIIMPSGFLPTAERFGLSAEIDAWVIEHAIRLQAAAKARGERTHISINLSGQSLTSERVRDLIPRVLHETGVDPASLTFEVTETAAIADMNIAIAFLAALQELGCVTALDDFGSGMSSFAYLRELPVDVVKIDGRFVKNIARNAVDRAMVKAMNEIAHALEKKTVAEFVEDEAAYQVLRELGVDFCQGYYLGKPKLV